MPTMLAEADTYPRGNVVAGRYELADVVSSGASSSVLRARDRRTGFPVAVKLVSSLRGAVEDARRVAVEADALGRISSRNVASAHDHGVDPSYGAFLVLDLVEGAPLGPDLLGRPFFPHEVLRAARGLLSGLAAAHAAGVVHHDVRPANVLVPGERLESAVLVDFDVSNVAAEDDDVWGTRRYSAPERLAGQKGDTRSDVFSAGMLLYELLGLPLVRSVDADEGLAVPLGLVPKPLSTLLERMVANDPSRRFITASDALAVVLDLDTAPIEDGVDPRVSPGVKGMSTKAPSPGFVRLFRLADDPKVALRECLVALDVVLLDALVRREPSFAAARTAREALGLGFRAALASAAADPDAAPFVSALLSSRAARALGALPPADFDAADPETHATLATFAAVLATPGTSREALALVRRAAARLRQEGATARGALTSLSVAEAALSVYCEDRPARSAMADMRSAVVREGIASAPSPLDRLARTYLLGTIALHEDPALARAELTEAATLALDAKCALLEACVLAELGRLACMDAGTRELGLGWLVRVEQITGREEAPTFAHTSHHERGAAALVRGHYAEAARAFAVARDAIADEARPDEHALSSAGLALASLASGDTDRAGALVSELVEPRLAACEARTAAFALLARAMAALVAGDLSRARRDVERAQGYAVRVVRGSRDAVGLVEVADALLNVEGLPAADAPRRNLLETALLHTAGARSFVPLFRAIASRVPVAALRVPILAAAEAALREVGAPPSEGRITQPPPPHEP